MSRLATFALLVAVVAGPALAQDKGTLDPQPLPPLEHPKDPQVPAKQLFGRKATPTEGKSEVLGFYSKGCMSGAQALPVNGPTWQVMRLSRNRNWGQPQLIAFLERFSAKVPKVSEWKGILVGDMAQPRGGPMITGHLSHQVGLDADIWLTPMPDYEQTRKEREEKSATMIVAKDRKDVDPKVWTPSLLAVIKTAAQDRDVTRILVNPAINGHDYHMHVRIGCPAGATHCKPQDPPADNDGCGADLAQWFKKPVVDPTAPVILKKPKPQIRLADLPPACKTVLDAP